MKRRLLAIVLVLMMAVSLLPATAMADDDYIYVSVNGVAFTELDQTIPCGSGTATLCYDYYNDGFELVLENATIDKFENMVTQDGVAYYAGIVFQGNVPLEICTYGKTTIKAPGHNSSRYYEGILADGDVTFSDSGPYNTSSFTISGVDCGIDGVNGVVNMDSVIVYVTASDAGIICDELTNHGTYLTVNSTGNVGIAANTVNSDKGIVVTLTPDVKKGYSDCYGMTAETYNLKDTNTVPAVNRFTVNYDGSAYKGTEPITVCGLAVSAMNCVSVNETTVEANMKVSGTKNINVIGISADTCAAYEIKCNLKLRGEHGEAVGLYAETLKLPYRLTSTISGAAPEDLAVMAGSIQKGNAYDSAFDFFYAETDCAKPECGVLYVENGVPESLFVKYKMFEPEFGGFSSLYEDGKGGIAVDADGNPTNVLLIRYKDYPFLDIEGDTYKPYRDAITWASESGITKGVDRMNFGPDQTCTRAQIVTFLWRAVGCPEPTITENPFVDISATGGGAPYYKPILWAYENGITAGTDETHFSPNQGCTRGQVVTFLWRAMGRPEPGTQANPFVDVKDSSYYYKPVLWAYENGITAGTDATHFSPEQICTRAQIVTFIYRDRNELAEIADKPVAVSAEMKTETEHADNRHTIKYFVNTGKNYRYLCPVNFEVSFSDGSNQLYTFDVYCDYEKAAEMVAEVVTVRDGKVYLLIREKDGALNTRNGYIGKVVAFDPQGMKFESIINADVAWVSPEGTNLIGYYCGSGHNTDLGLANPEYYTTYNFRTYNFESGKSDTGRSFRDYNAYMTDEGVYFGTCDNVYVGGVVEKHWHGYLWDYDKNEEVVIGDAVFEANHGASCRTDESGFTLIYKYNNDIFERHFDFAGNEIIPQ